MVDRLSSCGGQDYVGCRRWGKIEFTAGQYGKQAHAEFTKDCEDTYPYSGDVARRILFTDPYAEPDQIASSTSVSTHRSHHHAKPIGVLHVLLIKCTDLFNADADEGDPGGLSDPRWYLTWEIITVSK